MSGSLLKSQQPYNIRGKTLARSGPNDGPGGLVTIHFKSACWAVHILLVKPRPPGLLSWGSPSSKCETQRDGDYEHALIPSFLSNLP